MEVIMGKWSFGTRKNDNVRIYLEEPSWDCGWYWGFGYLGNSQEHYHLSAYQEKQQAFKLKDGSLKVITEKRNMIMYDCLKEDYHLNPNIEKNLWKFCELVKTAYTLKETAEVLGRGGSHYTTNPVAITIKNEEEVKRINDKVLPAIFEQIKILIEEGK